MAAVHCVIIGFGAFESGSKTRFFAAMMSSAFLGETPHLNHVTAFALIVGGIVFSSRH